MSVVFKDPPARRRPKRALDNETVWTGLLRPLMTKRGQGRWARVRGYETPSAAASAAYDIRSGRNTRIPTGRWDATSRDGHLYVMFLGEE